MFSYGYTFQFIYASYFVFVCFSYTYIIYMHELYTHIEYILPTYFILRKKNDKLV